MAGSINFFVHLIALGFLFTSFAGGWILERQIHAEKDWNHKLLIDNINRRFRLLSIIALVVLLFTGTVNIINQYGSQVKLWNTSSWLIAKIILFAFLLVNGTTFGPTLIRRRKKIIQSITEKIASDDAEANVRLLNKSISTYYLVQLLLLIIIIYLSILGGGKHPGII